MENSLKQAEHHYIEGGAWSYAVDMYRARDMWEEALRVAKANGSQKELGEIAIKVAENMGLEKGTNFLIKNGLIEAAVDFEANQERFEEAFKLAENHAKYKLPEVHLKYALHLEDENRFKEAEEEFIKANKPQEAINMYEHK
jgi:intraflagellar transport protein 172